MLIESPNKENCNIKKISIHSVKGGKQHSNVEECANLCKLHGPQGVKSFRKYKFCKDDAKMDAQDYHTTTIDDKIYGNDIKMKATGFCKAIKGNFIQIF